VRHPQAGFTIVLCDGY